MFRAGPSVRTRADGSIRGHLPETAFGTRRGRASTEIILSPRLLLTGISIVVGFVSSFLGIGGGIIHVPALAGILYFPMHIATATSHFILAIVTCIGVLVHVLSGTFEYGIVRTAFLALGFLVGAQGGAFLSSKVKGGIMIRALSVALALMALRLLLLSLGR